MGERRGLEIGRERRGMGVGLARKPDDEVRPDGGIRHPPADVVHQPRIALECVGPPHGGQQLVGRVLQRQVQVCGKARGMSGHGIEHVRRAVHRLERTHAHAEVAGLGRQGPQQRHQRPRRRQIAAPRPEMNAGQGDFPVAGRHDLPELVEHVVERAAAAGAARRRDDAVAAEFVAPGLRAQGPGRPAHEARAWRPAARALARRKVEHRQQRRGERGLGHVGHERGHTREGPYVSGRARRETSGDDDSGRGVLAVDPANGLPRALVGAGRHGAGVHEHHVGLVGGDGDRPGGRQRGFDAERIGLIDATPEGDDGVFHGCEAATARAPMSVRYCIPAKWMRATAS